MVKGFIGSKEKAGSGKSTLISYIWNNPITLQELAHWSAGFQTLAATFLFLE
jgi:hypothetical protein